MNTDTPSDYLYVKLRQLTPIPLSVDFTCGKNELIVLVGPSGSGKTTLLRSIAGLHHVSEAIIKVAEEIWCDSQQKLFRPARQRRAGFVFQHYALFPHLTVARNIALAIPGKEKSRSQQEIDRILALVNLQGMEQRYPGQLSGGQQQRVALARALARDPALLLLDEPFSAVDMVTRRKLRRELVRIRQQLNIPIIFVTHDLDEAYMLADRLFIIHEGRLLQNGYPADVLARPASARVAHLLDLNNIFKARIKSHDRGRKITLLQWGDTTLECSINERFSPDESVDWVIPPDSIILHRVDRPSQGERENPVDGIIEQCLSLGENTSITVRLEGQASRLSFNVPTHVARRNKLAELFPIRVSLLASAIHLMSPGE